MQRSGEENQFLTTIDMAIKEMEVKQAKYLLMRMRNEEMNLRKSIFDREKKGLNEFEFEENLMQHR